MARLHPRTPLELALLLAHLVAHPLPLASGVAQKRPPLPPPHTAPAPRPFGKGLRQPKAIETVDRRSSRRRTLFAA